MTQEHITYRFARREDIPTILGFIRELAAYEHLEQEVVAILAKAEIQVVAGLVLVVSWILFDRMITRLKQRVK